MTKMNLILILVSGLLLITGCDEIPEKRSNSIKAFNNGKRLLCTFTHMTPRLVDNKSWKLEGKYFIKDDLIWSSEHCQEFVR